MSITAFSGPVVVFGQNPSSFSDYNPDLGSSLFYAGGGILDPRTPFTYFPGESQAAPDFGWYGFSDIVSFTGVPYTNAAAAIVASANPTSATLSLVTTNSATTGVYYSSVFTRSDTGATATAGGPESESNSKCDRATDIEDRPARNAFERGHFFPFAIGHKKI